MGSSGTYDLGAFQNLVFPEGLDLRRSVINEALGVFVADPAGTFRAGMALMRNASGFVVPSDGTDFVGVAKWNHTSTVYSAKVDESIVMTGTAWANLARGLVSNVRVCSAVKGGGTEYTEGAALDYEYVAATGAIRRGTGPSTIPSGTAVYATYTYQLSEAEMTQQQGKNFWNTMDEVAQADYRCAVITQAELIYTMQYHTKAIYTLTGAMSNVILCDSAARYGMFSAEGYDTGLFVGRVFQVPSASDPYLGFRLMKQVVEM